MIFVAMLFAIGWATGILAEYVYHRIMHIKKLQNHMQHHKEYHHLDALTVANNARCLRVDMKHASVLLLLFVPFALLFGWVNVIAVYLGIFWHLMVLYQISHHIIHDDRYVPAVLRTSRLFRWWQACHIAHHKRKPRRNYCVTVPILDCLFGTYEPPRGSDSPR